MSLRPLGCLVAAILIPLVAQAAPRVSIEVQETAGIRRFQYPVAVELRLPEGVTRDTHFRLLHGGQPVLAQLCPAEEGATVTQWWLDFPVDLLPFETGVYELQCGSDVPTGPTRKPGHRLIANADAFQVVNEPHIGWTVPRDLQGLLQSVKAGEIEYLKAAPSSGLVLCDSAGHEHVVGGPKSRARVTRSGPLAVGLAFDGVETAATLADVRWSVQLTFPVFKTWVEVDWQIEDSRANVSAALARFPLNVDAPTRAAPTLLDFGATSLVYLSLGPAQEAQLRGVGPDWKVLRGAAGRLEPFVDGPRSAVPNVRPEGWMHLMDRRRCAALAVARFAATTDDRMLGAADGRLELTRSFAARTSPAIACQESPVGRASNGSPVSGSNAAKHPDMPTNKRLRFWLHVVPFPPQQTAATSPQAMQNPLLTRVHAAAR